MTDEALEVLVAHAIGKVIGEVIMKAVEPPGRIPAPVERNEPAA